MIASFRHGFIFLKSKKSGGSAAESALAPLCGPDDVVTPAGFDEPLSPGGEARNFTSDPETQAIYDQAAALRSDPGHKVYIQIDRRCREAGDFHAHMTAKQARSKLGQEFWDRAFKFTIERHPYERAVSQAWFTWARLGGPGQDFEAFFDHSVRTGPYLNNRFYLIKGQPAVDRILRYERLDEDLRDVGARFGLVLPEPLPSIKGGFRKDRRPAGDILTEDQKAAIRARCTYEFEVMGYEP
jgi:hypothetical protein